MKIWQRAKIRWKPVVAVVVLAGTTATVAVWSLLRDSPLDKLPQILLEDLNPALKKAIAEAKDGVVKTPRSGEAWGKLGMVLQANDFVDEPRICFRMAERLDGKKYRWPYLLGMNLAESDSGAAAECFERAVRLDGDLDYVRLRLAELLLKQRRLEAAESHLRAVIEREPKHPRAAFGLSKMLFLRKEWEKSRDWALTSATAASGRRETHLLLAQVYRRLNDEQAATEQLRILERIPAGQPTWRDPVFEQVIALRRDARWVRKRAERLFASGQIPEAVLALREAVSREPDDPELSLFLASMLIRSGEIGPAGNVLEAALSHHPESVDLHVLRGSLEYRQRRWKSAERIFRDALRIQPDYALVHFNLAQCLEKLGRIEAAIIALQAAVGHQPDLVEAHLRLCELLVRAGRRKEAVKQLKAAIRYNLDDTKLRDQFLEIQ